MDLVYSILKNSYPERIFRFPVQCLVEKYLTILLLRQVYPHFEISEKHSFVKLP